MQQPNFLSLPRGPKASAIHNDARLVRRGAAAPGLTSTANVVQLSGIVGSWSVRSWIPQYAAELANNPGQRSQHTEGARVRLLPSPRSAFLEVAREAGGTKTRSGAIAKQKTAVPQGAVSLPLTVLESDGRNGKSRDGDHAFAAARIRALRY